MLTGDGAAKDKATALAPDAEDHIVKPVAPRDGVDRVSGAIWRRRETTAAKAG